MSLKLRLLRAGRKGRSSGRLASLPQLPSVPVLPSRDEVLESLLEGLQARLEEDVNDRCVCKLRESNNGFIVI